MSDTSQDSILRTQMEESVVAAQDKARSQMANRYNQRFVVERFEIDDIVSIRIPKEDRSTLDHCRLYGRVIAYPHTKRYQLQTQYGILDRHFSPAQLNRVSPLLGK